MKKIVVQLTFEDEGKKITKLALDGILRVFAELDITPGVATEGYTDEYGGPVIYFP